MVQTAASFNLYQQLCDLPEGLTGEILNGQLHTQPRPAGPHALVASSLGGELINPFQKGRGGPGGWWILDEPEIHFLRDVEVAVPDLGGWRRERMPSVPRGHRFEVVPDWVCEILSPSTASKDREVKLPLYARYGVEYAWLVDPLARTLEVYRLQDGTPVEICRHGADEQVAVVPFEAVVIELAGLWG